MWELDHKGGWVQNWCFQTVVPEKTLKSPLGYKKIKSINPKRNKPCIFIGSPDVEAESPIFWPPVAKNWLTGKDPDAGKDWREEEKGTTEDEMVGWNHWLDGHSGGGGFVTKSCSTLPTPWTVAFQAPLFMGFSRQEYWSGLPFLYPLDRHESANSRRWWRVEDPGSLHSRVSESDTT